MENRNETCNLFAMTFIEVKMAGWPELPNTLFFLQCTLKFLLYIRILLGEKKGLGEKCGL